MNKYFSINNSNNKKENLVLKLSKNTILHGPSFIGGSPSTSQKIYKISAQQKQKVTEYIKSMISLFLREGTMSELTRQVLSNANQKLSEGSLDIEGTIEYVKDWLDKISVNQILSRDELLLKKYMTSDLILSNLDIEKIEIELHKIK